MIREIREEMGVTISRLSFNRTRFLEPSNTLMVNFTAFVNNAASIHPNIEIDRYEWFSPDEAQKNIKPGSLAGEFLTAYLEESTFRL